MSDNKFEFTEKERNKIVDYFCVQFGDIVFVDSGQPNEHVLNYIEHLISSRSESPQQGTEGADEVLKKEISRIVCGLNIYEGSTYPQIIGRGEAVSELLALTQSQVEQAVKEKDKQISDLTFFNQEHQSYQNLSEIVIGRQKEQIAQLEAALKVQTEHVADLMASSLVRPELKVPGEKQMFEAAERFYEDNEDGPYGRVTAFLEGAKWMRDKITPQ